MVNEGHGLPGGGTDGPTAPAEVDLVIGVDAAAQVQRQVQVRQGWGRDSHPARAPLGLRLGAGFIRRPGGGAADGAVLPGQFTAEQFLGGGA